MSGKLELAGLGIAGIGFVTVQPEITAPGLALAASGGIGNIGAGVLQFGAGLLQGAGSGGFSNSGYAALSVSVRSGHLDLDAGIGEGQSVPQPLISSMYSS